MTAEAFQSHEDLEKELSRFEKEILGRDAPISNSSISNPILGSTSSTNLPVNAPTFLPRNLIPSFKNPSQSPILSPLVSTPKSTPLVNTFSNSFIPVPAISQQSTSPFIEQFELPTPAYHFVPPPPDQPPSDSTQLQTNDLIQNPPNLTQPPHNTIHNQYNYTTTHHNSISDVSGHILQPYPHNYHPMPPNQLTTLQTNVQPFTQMGAPVYQTFQPSYAPQHPFVLANKGMAVPVQVPIQLASVSHTANPLQIVQLSLAVPVHANPSLEQFQIPTGEIAKETISEKKTNAIAQAKNKPKKLLRSAANQVWHDKSIEEWDNNDHRIFCGDLGNEVNDDTLYRAFSHFASLQKVKVIRDKRTHKSRGYGFASFKDPKDFLSAMKEVNGKYIGNRPVKLRKSTWKDRNFENVKKKTKEKKKLGLR